MVLVRRRKLIRWGRWSISRSRWVRIGNPGLLITKGKVLRGYRNANGQVMFRRVRLPWKGSA